MIAQCQSAEDVAAALKFATDNGLEVAVRGGGHSVAGKALTDGGLVVDLRRMNAVAVDPTAMRATVGGGATSWFTKTAGAMNHANPKRSSTS